MIETSVFSEMLFVLEFGVTNTENASTAAVISS